MQPETKAGDVILFSEGTVHGAGANVLPTPSLPPSLPTPLPTPLSPFLTLDLPYSILSLLPSLSHTHTAPWNMDYQRRLVLYRFAPSFVGYGRAYTNDQPPRWPASYYEVLPPLSRTSFLDLSVLPPLTPTSSLVVPLRCPLL